MKRYFKKFTSILLALVVVLSISGCGNEVTQGNGKENDSGNEPKLTKPEVKLELVSDDTKLVYNYMDVYKIVYYYSGDKITGLEHYYPYTSQEMANHIRTTFDSTYNEGNIKSIDQKDNNIVVTLAENQYKDLTVEGVKQTYKNLEELYKTGSSK